MKSILKVVFVVIGTIIGAGFASGQEIWLFFNQYGNGGAIGMIASCSLSGIIIYQVLRIAEKMQVASYDELLIPALILFILYLGVQNLDFTTSYLEMKALDTPNAWQWIISSILYASYNSIMLVPMLIELKPYITSKAEAKQVGGICAVILSLLGVSLFSLLLRGNERIYNLELPMIEIVKELVENSFQKGM